MHKVKKTIVLLLTAVLVFSSCSMIENVTEEESMLGFFESNGQLFRFIENTDEINDATVTRVIEAIESRDREQIRGLFSEKALEDTQNIEEGIDYLLETINEPILSWEYDHKSGGDDYTNPAGKKQKIIRPRITITLESGMKYNLFIKNYYVDTIDPTHEGIQTICLEKEFDPLEEYYTWADQDTPGIFIPPSRRSESSQES